MRRFYAHRVLAICCPILQFGLSRSASPGASTQPSHRAAPDWGQILRANAFIVVQVKDADAFDRLLERIARALPEAQAATQPAELSVDREPIPHGEQRVYRIGDRLLFRAGRTEKTYILAEQPGLVEAALTAGAGGIPNMLIGTLSKPVLDTVPAQASKLLMVRVDLLTNLRTGMRLAAVGLEPARYYPPVPSMKPAVAYTVEDEKRIEVMATLSDLPIMTKALLQVVTGPPLPTRRPRPAPATGPRP